MSAKHTPGPWHRDATCGGLAIESERHGNVGLVNLARASKADATLIASAPDLLALAHQYASECAACNGTGNAGNELVGDEDCPDCADIRAVIDKAEGRA